jgi:hypothetical protein
MSNLLISARGKVFTHPVSKKSYGPIRPASRGQLSKLNGTKFEVLGEDSCGNCFAAASDGGVLFWDHETDDLVRLADSINEFVSHCTEPPQPELNPKQIKSAWIDPDFAKSIGKQVPKDGWLKKKDR